MGLIIVLAKTERVISFFLWNPVLIFMCQVFHLQISILNFIHLGELDFSVGVSLTSHE